MDRIMRLLFGVLLMGLLTNCGGSDGEPGSQGSVGKHVVTESTSLNLTVKSINTSSGSLKVNFEATTDEGVLFVGVQKPKFTVAKLIPAKNGSSSEWQSFIYNNTGTQVTYDTDGEFVDNKNGTYSYTFSNDVLNAAGIPWDERTTHRVAMEVSENTGKHPVANGVYDWVPSGESLIHTRDIVAIDTCNGCHTTIAKHGGTKLDTGYCVTCHNPGSSDVGTADDSGNTLDFKVMVHKIHMGKELPGINAQENAEYFINNGWTGKHVYAEKTTVEVDGESVETVKGVGFPQDIRNCTNCHVGEGDKLADPSIKAVATLDGDNWKNVQNMETCGSCHDNIAFNDEQLAVAPWKTAHPNQSKGGVFPVANEDCSSCHSVSSPGNSSNVNHTAVLPLLKKATEAFEIKPLSIAANTNSTDLDVTISIKLNNQAVTDLAVITPLISGGDGYVQVNWDDGTGYQMAYSSLEGGYNPDSNLVHLSECLPASEPASVAGDFTCTWAGHKNGKGNPFDVTTSQGTIVVTFADMPLCVDTGSKKLADCTGSDIAVVSPTPTKAYFDLSTMDLAPDYKEAFAADKDSCNNCHVELPGHATSHAATEFTQCKSCHNASKAAWYLGRPGDLKSHVHTFHAFNDKLNNKGTEHYPGKINDCTACHTDSQYDLPLTQNPRPSRAVNSSLSAVFTSPTTTVCASCHISIPVGVIDSNGKFTAGTPTAKDQEMVNHMITTGGAVFGVATIEEATGSESCSTCHAKGKEFGVDIKHGLAK